MNTQNGTVAHLQTKLDHGQPMLSPANDKLTLISGYGIREDINANPASPRQVLLLGLDVLQKYDLHPGDLRANIIISGFDVNQVTSGSAVCIGSHVTIRTTFGCEVCHKISHLSVEPRELMGQRGVLGIVTCGGEISVGDSVSVVINVFAQFPVSYYDRFLWVVKRIPQGSVISYRQLVTAIGAPKNTARAIPAFIKRTDEWEYPVHRIVDSKYLSIEHVHDQLNLLAAEYVVPDASTDSFTKYQWNMGNLFEEG